jgi:hypothetical protein
MESVIVTAAADPSGWTDERLRVEWQAVLAERTATTEKMARLYVAMKGRGLLTATHPLDEWLEAVAAGTLKGWLVEHFHHRPSTLRLLATLSAADQERVAAGEKFEVVQCLENCNEVAHSDGEVTRLAVAQMDPGQAHQVIRRGRILTADEQRRDGALVEPKPRAEPQFTPRLDRERVSLRVGHGSVPIPKVLDALAGPDKRPSPPLDLRGDEQRKAGCETIGVVFWEEELRKLDVAARRSGLPTNELIRKAVNAYLGTVLADASGRTVNEGPPAKPQKNQ